MVDHGFYRQSKQGFFTQSPHEFRRGGGVLYACGDGGPSSAQQLDGEVVTDLNGTLTDDPLGLGFADSTLYVGTDTIQILFPPGTPGRLDGFLQFDEDADTWGNVLFGINGRVNKVVNHEGILRLGGNFIGPWDNNAKSSTTSDLHLTGWDGVAYQPMNSSALGIAEIFTLAVDADGTLWCGTNHNPGSSDMKHPVFKWFANNSISGVGGVGDLGTGGASTVVHHLQFFEGDMVATGDFDNGAIEGVARSTGGTWSTMGSLKFTDGRAMAVHDGDLYMSGTEKSGSITTTLFKWDVTTQDWVAQLDGVADIDISPSAMTSHDGLLYLIDIAGGVKAGVLTYNGETLENTDLDNVRGASPITSGDLLSTT